MKCLELMDYLVQLIWSDYISNKINVPQSKNFKVLKEQLSQLFVPTKENLLFDAEEF
jgi:hypothetical protein